jgi:anaerobic selenocysteine-containing dehydrogenase
MGLCKAIIALDDDATHKRRRPARARYRLHRGAHAWLAASQRCAPAAGPRSSASRAWTAPTCESAAYVYARQAVIGVYGMGLTQHRNGVQNVQMLVNLLLLRGNIGKPGAGICPVRGHSNVQGQRTVGITEKPELAPLDKLKEQYGFEPPRDKGMNTVEACEGDPGAARSAL